VTSRAIGVLVSGSGTNLQALLDEGLPVAAVASSADGVRALERARAAGVPAAVFRLAEYPDRGARDGAMAAWLEDHGVRLAVCAGFMQLLTPAFLSRLPAINVHPSLLPHFPGTRAIEDALAAGVEETGVTVHVVDEGVDTGPIVLQEAVPVLAGDTSESLRERLHAVEHRLLPQAVRCWLDGDLELG
jgi:phosphoribosylglycinamide formyltransferase-1